MALLPWLRKVGEAMSVWRGSQMSLIETFGREVFEGEPPVLEAFVAEARGCPLRAKFPAEAPKAKVIRAFTAFLSHLRKLRRSRQGRAALLIISDHQPQHLLPVAGRLLIRRPMRVARRKLRQRHHIGLVLVQPLHQHAVMVHIPNLLRHQAVSSFTFPNA